MDTQEMSAADPDFGARVSDVYAEWRDGFAEALGEGQKRGTVCDDVDTRATASFLIASLSGSWGFGKATNSVETMTECIRTLAGYLESLRQ